MRRTRGVAALMALEAASLAAMSALHLSGALDDGHPPFGRSHAGVAEALIAAALAAGVAVPRLALPSVVFAIAGFGVGLAFTIGGDGAVDIAYHATVLPLLAVTLVALRRRSTLPDAGRAA